MFLLSRTCADSVPDSNKSKVRQNKKIKLVVQLKLKRYVYFVQLAVSVNQLHGELLRRISHVSVLHGLTVYTTLLTFAVLPFKLSGDFLKSHWTLV